MRALLGFVTVCCGGLLAFSYAGAWHPAGDSFAVFRLWIAAGLLLLGFFSLVSRARIIGFTAVISALISAGAIVPMFMGAPANLSGEIDADVVVYSKNTLGGRGDDVAIVADIRASGADIVLLQELSETRSDFVGQMRDTLGYSHICRFSDWSGIGVISRWPIEETYCSPHRSFAAAYVVGPDGPFWAVSTHLVWPFPYGQWRFLDEAMPFLESVSGPAVVGGDFNMPPWGASVRRIGRATGTSLIGPVRTTLWVRKVPLQIDNFLSNGTGQVIVRPQFGSDHFGVVARIIWP